MRRWRRNSAVRGNDAVPLTWNPCNPDVRAPRQSPYKWDDDPAAPSIPLAFSRGPRDLPPSDVGANVLMCDGAVRFIDEKVESKPGNELGILPALGCRAGQVFRARIIPVCPVSLSYHVGIAHYSNSNCAAMILSPM